MKLMKYQRISNWGDYPQSVLVQNHFLIVLLSLCLVFHPLFMFPPSPIASNEITLWTIITHITYIYVEEVYLLNKILKLRNWRNFARRKKFMLRRKPPLGLEEKVASPNPLTWVELLFIFLSGALIYFFEWSSYLLNFLRTRRH